MFTFEWDDLQARRDRQLPYSQGLTGCKNAPNEFFFNKALNHGRGAVILVPTPALLHLGLCPHGTPSTKGSTPVNGRP